MLIKDHKTYSDFFRLMAQHHKRIHHTPERVAFARVNLSAHPVLAREDIGEFLKGMKSRLHFPALLLNAYTSKFKNEDSNDAKRMLIQGEFIVLDRFQRDDWDRQEEIFDEMSTVGTDIMAFMGEYYEEHPEEGYFDWKESLTEKISNLDVDNLSGVKFYFTIDIPFQVALNLNTEAFDDELFES